MTTTHDVRHRTGARRWSACALLTFTLGLAACSGGDTTAPAVTLVPSGSSLAVVSGSGQVGTVGSALSAPLVVKVATADGTPIASKTVTFAVTSGSATVAPATTTTDATGQATAQVTLGATSGSVVVTATVQGTVLSTTFTVTAREASTATASCDPAGATTLAVGQATTPSGTALCLSGGSAGAEYALVPFNGATNPASLAQFTVNPTNVVAVTTALGAASASSGSLGATLAAAPRTGARAFEARLRATSIAELTPRIAGARAWYRAGRTGSGARLNVIPSTASVGSLVSLNANGEDACTRATPRTGRIVAIGSKAIVVADTLNPTGGYTTAEYQSIATTFDTLVDAVDTKNFGQPSDIDGNGHVVLFFTSAVNALTPRNADYYIGGFFFSRDLFPTKSTATLDGCAASNVAEMFYLLVPDPNGSINGNKFSKTFVTNVTISTTAHEYQHLINASRRLYVNTTADDFEATWLDEGLAHVAEELLFYARAGLAPGLNLDATTIRRSATAVAAFNDDQSANYARLEEYLLNPSANSPYADNDSLATRGATWSFLRFAADRRSTATDQSATWMQLVNSTTTGMANLQRVFGTDLTSLFRDWSTSLLLDDVSGADALYAAPSWNYRSIYSALSTNGTYPLKTTALADGAPASVSIAGGSAAYLRFAVGAGRTGSVSWGSLPSDVQLTLVRLK